MIVPIASRKSETMACRLEQKDKAENLFVSDQMSIILKISF